MFAEHFAVGLHMRLFSFRKPQRKFVSPCKSFFGEDFTPTHLCSLHFLSRTCAGACYCRKDWVPTLVSTKGKYRTEEEAAGSQTSNYFWRMGNCQLWLTFLVISVLMLHLKKKKKKEHSLLLSAAFCADLQCFSMVLLELEIRSTRQELPGLSNSGISTTFTKC